MKLTGKSPEQGLIHDLTADGIGIATVSGKRVFVNGALPGETVNFLRRRRRRTYDDAQLLAIEHASPHRTEPPCPYFGRCGGCSLQHLDPASQLAHKDAILHQNLKRLGQVEAREHLPAVAGPAWGYRRRARLAVRDVLAKGRVLVGFRERTQPYITDMLNCETLRPEAARLIAPLSDVIGRLSIRARVPQVEISVADNATALVFRVLDEPTTADVEALTGFRSDLGVRILLQRSGQPEPSALQPGEDDETLFYTLPDSGIRIGFSPNDFVQVNADMNHELIQAALRLLRIEGSHRVLDLFCGLGNFSLPIASRAGSVVGVEIDARMVARAVRNARENGIGNAEFHAADLALVESGQPWQGDYDVAVLDPPRTGAAGVLPMLAASGVRRIVYISCHPGTLARDAGELVRTHGFVLSSAGVFDMFPQTSHVESIALFERR